MTKLRTGIMCGVLTAGSMLTMYRAAQHELSALEADVRMQFVQDNLPGQGPQRLAYEAHKQRQQRNEELVDDLLLVGAAGMLIRIYFKQHPEEIKMAPQRGQ